MDRFEKTLLFHLQHQLKDFKDKVIIDIAGMPTRLNKHFLAEGAAEIHGVNLDGLNAAHGTPPRGYHHHVADARALPKELPLADAVIACSALEHLSDFNVCLREALAKLKRGGVVVMHGGALWASNLGHHVWVPTPERNYCFGHPGDPMPPWGHLSHTEAELEQTLLDNGTPSAHARLICEQVHHSGGKNRRPASALRQDFQNAGQLLLGFTEYRWGVPNKAIFQRIHDRGHRYSLDDLMTGELIAVMQKF